MCGGGGGGGGEQEGRKGLTTFISAGILPL